GRRAWRRRTRALASTSFNGAAPHQGRRAEDRQVRLAGAVHASTEPPLIKGGEPRAAFVGGADDAASTEPPLTKGGERASRRDGPTPAALQRSRPSSRGGSGLEPEVVSTPWVALQRSRPSSRAESHDAATLVATAYQLQRSRPSSRAERTPPPAQ